MGSLVYLQACVTHKVTNLSTEQYLSLLYIMIIVRGREDSLLSQMDSCPNRFHSIAANHHCIQWVILKEKRLF